MIVAGLGFGDEGKGLTTSYLCSITENPIVVRYNGGHQAGHTVVHKGKRHVFSNFGSGTLQGAPTFWSSYCTFNPINFLNEFKALGNAEIYVDPQCPVTTPFDRAYNRTTEKLNQHGSCGSGFGATIEREESHYRLLVQDIFFENVMNAKMEAISTYYANKLKNSPYIQEGEYFKKVEEELDLFSDAVKEARKIIRVANSNIFYERKFNPVFEGAQGILLDMDFGFFPHVTRSNTVTKNAHFIYAPDEVFYVTRGYQTRHGNGFMTNESIKPELINNEQETNQSNEWQGEFRTGALDIDLLNYALHCDKRFSGHLKKNLVITCIDQTGERITATEKGNTIRIDIDALPKKLNCQFQKVLISKGPSLEDISELKLEYKIHG
jgi:adenylosuccinate synthase